MKRIRYLHKDSLLRNTEAPLANNPSERKQSFMKTNIWNSKRFLSLFLALVMLVGMLPMNALPVFAVEEDEVAWSTSATATDFSYGTFAQAVTAANAADSTVGFIALRSSVELTETAAFNPVQPLTLDINNLTLSAAAAVSPVISVTGGNVTITDYIGGGSITATGGNVFTVSGGTLTLSGGAYSAAAGSAVISYSGGSIVITGTMNDTVTISFASAVDNVSDVVTLPTGWALHDADGQEVSGSVTAGTTLTASATVSEIASGTCGASGNEGNVTWKITGNAAAGYTLTISGTGAMADYPYINMPWSSYCDDITSVVVGEGVTHIGDYAFAECSALKTVSLPTGLVSIGESAFDGCSSLESIAIPDSVTEISTFCFYNCSKLGTVHIGSGVTSIGSWVFYGCTSLTSFTVSESNEKYKAVDGVLLSKDGKTLLAYPLAKAGEYSIPSGVETIQSGAFSYSKVTSVTIPASVTTVENETFAYCASLTQFVVDEESSSFTAIDGVLYTKDQTTLVVCPGGKGDVTVPEGVATIGERAFQGCAVASVTLPESLITIGEYAFYDCTSLSEIVIPAKVTSIGTNAFCNCTGLTTVTFHSTPTPGSLAFGKCTGLTTLNLYKVPTFDFSTYGNFYECTLSNITVNFMCDATDDVKSTYTTAGFQIGTEVLHFDSDKDGWCDGGCNTNLHEHNWSYAVNTEDSAQIIATCNGTGTCAVTDKTATITLVAPTGTLVFDGNAKTVGVEQSPAGVFTDVPDVKYTVMYEGDDGYTDALDTIGAGSYKATLTIGTATAEVTFTIDRATISTVTLNVTAPEQGEEPQSTVTSAVGYGAYIDWDPKETKFGFNTAYTATVTLSTDGNHQFADNIAVDGWTVKEGSTPYKLILTKTFPATRKAELQSVTPPDFEKFSEYHATEDSAISKLPTQVTYGTESGNVNAEIQWTCENYNPATEAVNTFTWTVKDGELADYANTNTIATTGKITVTNTDPIDVSDSISLNVSDIDYGSEPAPLYSLTTGTSVGTPVWTLTYSKDGGISWSTLEDLKNTDGKLPAGDYTVKAHYEDDTQIGEKTADFTVDKADASVTNDPIANILTYNGGDQALVIAGETNSGRMEYSLDNQNWSVMIPTGKNATTYTVWYKVVGDSNHSDTVPQSVAVTINQASLNGASVEVIGKYVYDGNAIELIADNVTVKLNGDTLKYGEDYTFAVSDNIEAGTATVTVTGTGNYTDTATGTFIIVDELDPTGEILIKNNGWKQFINWATFGLFCKDSVDVTVTADGTGSAVSKVEYLLSDEALAENNIPAEGWTTVTANNGSYKFSIQPQFKGAVYVRITDEGENAIVINSNGIVVYQDSVAGTNSVDYTYAENSDKDIAVTFNGNTVKSITCGGSTLTADTHYTVDYTNGKIVLKAAYLDTLNATTHTFTVSYNPLGVENSGVTDLTTTFTVKVVPTSIAGATVKVDGTFTYDDNAKEPDPVVVLNGKTLEKGKDYTVSYSDNENAGTATVTVEGMGNYTGSANGNFEIGRAKLTNVSVQQDGKLTYDGGNALTPAVTKQGTALNGAKVLFIFSANGTTYGAMPTFTEAGTYTVYYCAFTTDSNFYDLDGEFEVTIGKATVTEPTIASKPYTGTAQTAGISDTALYTVEKNLGGTAKGSYDVVLKLVDTKNYKWSTTDNAEVTVQFVISAAENAWESTPAISDWTYGETAKAPTFEAKFGNDKVVVTYAKKGSDVFTAEVPTQAGDYVAKFEVTGTEDYTGLVETDDFTIAKKAVTVTATDTGKTYGESDPALTYTNTDLVGNDVLTGITVTRASGENADTYTITASQTDGANPNYDITFVSGTFTINKAVLAVTADDMTATYGDAVPNYTVEYNGFVNGDDKDDLGGTLAFYCNYKQFSNKGEYKIEPHGLKSDNYVIGYNFGTLTVSAKPITVTIQTATSIYGEALADLKATDDGIVNGDTDVYSLATAATSTSNAGKYAITGTAKDGNYSITFANEADAYEITKREITITVDAKNVVVNTDLPTYTYTVDNLFGEDKLTTEPTLTSDADITVIGEYTITASGADAGSNYTIKYVPAKLTVLTDNAVDAAKGYEEELENYDPAKVTSEDKAELTELLNEINTILADETTTDNGKKALEEVKEQVEALIQAIDDAAKATDTENTEKVENVTSENVTPENKTDLEGAKEDLEKALTDHGSNMTEDEKKAIEDEIKRIDEAIKVIENVETAEGKIKDLPETITKNDEAAIKAAEEAYNALSDYEKSLVDKDVKKALDDAKAALAELNKPADSNSPNTGDNSNIFLWIVLLFISSGAVITLTVVDRKKRAVKTK